MREIKFRAWDKKKKQMFDVGLIDFVNNVCFAKSYISWATEPAYNDVSVDGEERSLVNIELMQYSDLLEEEKEVVDFAGEKYTHLNGKVYKVVDDGEAYTKQEIVDVLSNKKDRIISNRWFNEDELAVVDDIAEKLGISDEELNV